MEDVYLLAFPGEELPQGFHIEERPYVIKNKVRKAADKLNRRIAAEEGIGIGFKDLTEAAEAA